jgi:hypothetical protein
MSVTLNNSIDGPYKIRVVDMCCGFSGNVNADQARADEFLQPILHRQLTILT